MKVKVVDNVRNVDFSGEKDSVKPLIIGTLAKIVNATAELTGKSSAEVVRCMLFASVKSGFALPGFEFEASQTPEELLADIKVALSETPKAKSIKPEVEAKVALVKASDIPEKKFEIHMPAALKKKPAQKA